MSAGGASFSHVERYEDILGQVAGLKGAWCGYLAGGPE